MLKIESQGFSVFGSIARLGARLALRVLALRVLVLTVLVLVVLASSGLGARAAHADDTQLWSQYLFALHRAERYDVLFYYEARLRDQATQASGWFSGPKITYRLHDNLWVGGAIKHIELKGDDVIDGRLELEVTPRGHIGRKVRVEFRNRVEVFHRRSRSDSTRFRHRLRLNWMLERGKLDRLFSSMEWFHEDGDGLGDVIEERFVPLGARFRFSKRGSIDLYYLLRSRDRATGRVQDHVLGTFFYLRR
ncbi:MAG: DUF2490 domain-containing protein [Acidobacteriota bacterium]